MREESATTASRSLSDRVYLAGDEVLKRKVAIKTIRARGLFGIAANMRRS